MIVGKHIACFKKALKSGVIAKKSFYCVLGYLKITHACYLLSLNTPK